MVRSILPASFFEKYGPNHFSPPGYWYGANQTPLPKIMSSEATSWRMTCSAYVMLYVPFMALSVVARPSVLPATRVSTLSKRSAMPVPCASRRSATSASIWLDRMVTLMMVRSPSRTTARTITLPRNAILMLLRIEIPSFPCFLFGPL